MSTSHPRVRRRPQVGLLAVQCAAILVGSLLLIIGVLGFVPGVTSNLDALQVAGPHSDATLFGIFNVSIVDNLLHIIVGLAGLGVGEVLQTRAAYLLVGGVLYIGLFVYGLLVDYDSPANVLPVNSADNWLHLGIGATMVVFALTLAGTRVPTGAGGEVLVPPEEL